MGCKPIGTMLALASVLKPSAKADIAISGSSFVGMDACRNERLLKQGVQDPENVFQAIPDWIFLTGTGSSARHQGHLNAVFVRSIPGRPPHIDPTKILPQDGDIHLVGFKFCPDTNPFPTLEAASVQHTNTLTRLKTRSFRNLNRNNKACTSGIFRRLLGVGVLGAWQWRTGEGESGSKKHGGQPSRSPSALILAFS
eukprot:1137647-Pelagomonas_calceolata.AAC.1